MLSLWCVLKSCVYESANLQYHSVRTATAQHSKELCTLQSTPHHPESRLPNADLKSVHTYSLLSVNKSLSVSYCSRQHLLEARDIKTMGESRATLTTTTWASWLKYEESISSSIIKTTGVPQRKDSTRQGNTNKKQGESMQKQETLGMSTFKAHPLQVLSRSLETRLSRSTSQPQYLSTEHIHLPKTKNVKHHWNSINALGPARLTCQHVSSKERILSR